MDVSGVIRRVQANIGDKNGKLYDSTDFIDLCNDAQLRINREAKVITATHNLNTVDGTSEYALPTDFITAKNCRITTATTVTVLPQTSKESLNHFMSGRLSAANKGLPISFFVDGTKLGFYPVPDDIYIIDLEYAKVPTVLTVVGNSLSLPEYMHPTVVRLVIASIKETDEDYEAATLIRREAMAEVIELMYVSQNGSGESYPVVRDYDSWEYSYYDQD